MTNNEHDPHDLSGGAELVVPNLVSTTVGQEAAPAPGESPPPDLVPSGPSREGLRVSMSLTETLEQFPGSMARTVRLLLQFGTGRLEEENRELKVERADLLKRIEQLQNQVAKQQARSAVLVERIRQLKVARRLHQILQTLGGLVVGGMLAEIMGRGLNRYAVLGLAAGVFLLVVARCFAPTAMETVEDVE